MDASNATHKGTHEPARSFRNFYSNPSHDACAKYLALVRIPLPFRTEVYSQSFRSDSQEKFRSSRQDERPSTQIKRTHDAASAAIQHVRVDHRRRNVGVTQELLDGAYVVSSLEQMRRERMPHRVTTYSLANA